MRWLFVVLYASVALCNETPTQWYYRTVPGSQPLGHCWNGRDAHVKYYQKQWRVWCPGPQVDHDQVQQETPNNNGG